MKMPIPPDVGHWPRIGRLPSTAAGWLSPIRFRCNLLLLARIFLMIGNNLREYHAFGMQRTRRAISARTMPIARPRAIGTANRSARPPYRRFSVNGTITPRRNRVTCPVLEDTATEMQLAATLIAAAAAWRLPSPLGRL